MSGNKTKTINRGQLKRLVERGDLEARTEYCFDETMGCTQGDSSPWKPARLRREYGDTKQGFFNISDFSFRTKSGAAWQNPNGTITLMVHGNEYIELRRRK